MRPLIMCVPMAQKATGDQVSEIETVRHREDTLMRMLATPGTVSV
jgi:hypothetical protein